MRDNNMNLNTVKLKNISNANIELCTYTIVPDEEFVLFDINNPSGYDVALRVSMNYNGTIDVLCSEDKLQMIIDDSEIATQARRNELYLWVNSMYSKYQVGYFNDNFYFDMKANQLIIKNPFNSRTYFIQLAESNGN
jgi:hypothetical protein